METKENELNQRAVLEALSALFLAEDVNSYAIENAALGRIKAGDKVSAGRYACDMRLPQSVVTALSANIEGRAIDEYGRLRLNAEDENFRKEFYTFGMSVVFDDAPAFSNDFDDDGMLPFKFGLKEYLLGLYPLFEEIAALNVEYDVYDLLQPFGEQTREVYRACRNLVADIKIKGIKAGKCVDKYIKDLPDIPYFVSGILRLKNGKYYLAANAESEEYKLALLSVLPFRDLENAALFELKAKAWEKRYAALIS